MRWWRGRGWTTWRPASLTAGSGNKRFGCGCGLRRPVYLVEDHGSMQHFSIPEDTLLQAITNTQVTDGFFVKRTHDIKESAAYLTILTRHLQAKYAHSTLYGYEKRHLARAQADEQPSHIKLLTFKDFDRTSQKSRPLTVQETFGKHLCQIAGCTAEKAILITGRYPTPKSLIEAYSNTTTQKERESLLSDLKFGPQKRSIGAQLPRIIAQLYSVEIFS